MICVVEGAVGSGKTYYCVKMVADHLRAGGVVATNLVLDKDALRRLCHRRLSSRQFIEVDADTDPATIPRGDLRGHGSRRVLVVLDEALNWFASSASKEDPRKASWSRWLRQSDKLGQRVVFVAQAFDRSAKWIRELSQLVVSVRNLGQLRVVGIPIGRFLGLSFLSVAVTHDLTIQQRTGTEFYTLNSDVWRCYDTAALYGFEASGNAYDRLGLWPPHPVPRLAFSLLGLWAAWGFLRLVLSRL